MYIIYNCFNIWSCYILLPCLLVCTHASSAYISLQSEPDLHRWRVPKMEDAEGFDMKVLNKSKIMGVMGVMGLRGNYYELSHEPWTLWGLWAPRALRRLFSMFSTFWKNTSDQDVRTVHMMQIDANWFNMFGWFRKALILERRSVPLLYSIFWHVCLISQPPCFRQPAPKQFKLGCLGLSWVVLGCLATNLNQQISCRISLNLTESQRSFPRFLRLQRDLQVAWALHWCRTRCDAHPHFAAKGRRVFPSSKCSPPQPNSGKENRTRWNKMEQDGTLKPQVAVNINIYQHILIISDHIWSVHWGEDRCGWACGKVRINRVDFLQICSLSQKNGQFARSVNGRDPWLCWTQRSILRRIEMDRNG